MSEVSNFDFSQLDTIDLDEESSFREELRIDKYNLDEECGKQPYLTFKWAALAAEAERRVNKAKIAMELCRANLDADIRKSPSKYGLETKMTESAIQGIILKNEDYRLAEDTYVEAKRRHGVVMAASRGINDKKSELDNLIKLFLNNYYAEQYVPKAVDDRARDSVRDDQNDYLNTYSRRKRQS